MKTCVHLRQHVAEFSKWDMFQTSAVEEINTHILCSKTFSKYEGWNFISGNYLFTTDTK